MSDPIFQILTTQTLIPLTVETSSRVFLQSALPPQQATNLPMPLLIPPRQMKLLSRAYTNPLQMLKEKKSALIGIIKMPAEDCYEPSFPTTGRSPNPIFAANIIQKNNKTSFTKFLKASSILIGIPNSSNNLKMTLVVKNGVLIKVSQSSANLVRENSNLS